MNRVKELRELMVIKQSDLAKVLNVSQGTLSNWERGVHDPDTESLLKLADYFDVTTDYLLGRSDNSTPAASVCEPEDEFEGLEFAFHDEYDELSEAHKKVLRHMTKILKQMEGK